MFSLPNLPGAQLAMFSTLSSLGPLSCVISSPPSVVAAPQPWRLVCPFGETPWAVQTGPCCGFLYSGVSHSHLAGCVTITVTRCTGNSSSSGRLRCHFPSPRISPPPFFSVTHSVFIRHLLYATHYQTLRL